MSDKADKQLLEKEQSIEGLEHILAEVISVVHTEYDYIHNDMSRVMKLVHESMLLLNESVEQFDKRMYTESDSIVSQLEKIDQQASSNQAELLQPIISECKELKQTVNQLVTGLQVEDIVSQVMKNLQLELGEIQSLLAVLKTVLVTIHTNGIAEALSDIQAMETKLAEYMQKQKNNSVMHEDLGDGDIQLF